MRLIVLGALLLGACSALASPDGAVQVIPARRAYAAGEAVSATFVNASEERVGYGACSLSLERRAGGGWIRVAPEEVPCISILFVLEPGRSVPVQFALDAALPAGSYRLRQEILPGTRLPARDVYSPAIEVRAP